MFEQKKLKNILHLETNGQYEISTKKYEKQFKATFIFPENPYKLVQPTYRYGD
jgi:hypothetical protein